MVILLPLDKKGILKTFYLFIFREIGMEGKREGEKHQCVFASYAPSTPQLGTWSASQTFALTGNQTSNLLVHRPPFNPLSHISLGE